MASIEELRKIRLEKRAILDGKGINSYPSDVSRDFSLKEVKDQFSYIEGEGKEISITGRVMSVRGQGAISFVDLYDGTERFQVVFKKDVELKYIGHDSEDGFELYQNVLDMGDFIEVKGILFVTNRGQESLEAHAWKMASKSLIPIPDEFYGLKDEDDRYRKRYLDLLMNPETRQLFEQKTMFWDATRNFMKDKGFMEVETPLLELTTGGAEATPFKTHHNDFDLDVYLRISIGELWQKRLMAGGLPKTFEIGKVFRNEGSSNEHVQEFTNMEFYWAYANFKDGMELTKELYRHIARTVFKTTKFDTRGHAFDLDDDWEEIDYVEKVKEITNIDVLSASEDEMKSKLKELGVSYEGENKERLIDTLWKYCRKQIAGPAFLINHPKIVSPLSKELSDKPGQVERFQPLLAGSEIGNGYSELNNPSEQKDRFDLQKELLEAGDTEAMMPDDEFVEMLEYGMPPTCGFGFGERLFAFMVDKPIREIQMFPLMKPRDSK